MADPFVFHSSKGARLFVSNTVIAPGGTGSVELDFVSGSMSPKNEIAKFVTSRTGRLPRREVTFADNTLNFSIEQNYLAQPTGTSGGNLTVLNTGTFAAALYLNVPYPTAPSNTDPCYNFSALVIESAPVSIQIEGKSSLSYSCPVAGPYTEPQ